MRLTIRFLALLLLLAIATFPYVGPTSTMADDGILIEEGGNPCLEGCQRTEISCRNDCGYNQDCVRKCGDDYRKCEAKCKPIAD